MIPWARLENYTQLTLVSEWTDPVMSLASVNASKV